MIKGITISLLCIAIIVTVLQSDSLKKEQDLLTDIYERKNDTNGEHY